ncbi:MAG: hypothetical protein AAGF47_09635, partial [Planctomycetota bacterium]
ARAASTRRSMTPRDSKALSFVPTLVSVQLPGRTFVRAAAFVAAAGFSAAGSMAAGQQGGLDWLAPEQAIDEVSIPGRELPAEEFPDAKTVFENYIEAIGGREAVFSKQTRRFTGSFVYEVTSEDGTAARQPGRVVSNAAAPDRYSQSVILPGLLSEMTYFDGTHGWRQDDQGNLNVLEGEELSRLRNSAQFYQVADYENLFKRYEVTGGVEQADGTRLVRVDVEFPSGRDESYVFDTETGLLTAVLSDRSIGNGQRVPLLRMYLDYAEFDGVKYPTRTTERYANVSLLFNVSNVETGIEMPDFETPQEVLDGNSDD